MCCPKGKCGCQYFILLTKKKKFMVLDFFLVCCGCRPSVNTICGRIMIGLSLLSSVSKHNMWSYYDWVVDVLRQTTYYFYWRPTTTINPIIIRPHIVLTDRRQQRQPNHNTTTYCVYWRTTTQYVGYKNNDNSIIIGPHIVFTDGQQQLQRNHNTTTYCAYWQRSSVSKHNMWSYYDWVVVVVVRQ
jgi:hypothetical protein